MENKQSTFRWFYCEKQGQIDFCKCEQCSLSNYGKDCQNNKIIVNRPPERIRPGGNMKCDKCSNYQPCMSGNDVYHYSACKNMMLIRAYKQAVMDGKLKNCKGFEKL